MKDKMYAIIQRVELKRLKPRQAVEEICSLSDSNDINDLVETITSWELDLYDHASIESIINEKYIIIKK